MDLKRTSFLLFIAVIWLCNAGRLSAKNSVPPEKTTLVNGPGGLISVAIANHSGALTYTVTFMGERVIEPSTLGLSFNGTTLGTHATIGKINWYSADEHYASRGIHSVAVNNFKGARIEFTQPGAAFTLDVRVFKDGAAFRYLVKNSGDAVVEKENTAFIIPAGSTVWSQNNIKYYEGKYEKKAVEAFQPGDLAGPPMTVLLPGTTGYAAITEGGLTDFAGMSLSVNAARSFQSNLTGPTKKNGDFETPWRIIEIGKDLNTLVNCDIIANVSPPPDPELFPKGYATDWIKPGRSVWSWLAVKRSVTLENMKAFSDFAAALGFEYNLVDEGWGDWKDGSRDNWDMMKELVDYSAKKGVKIWVWKAYPDRKGIPGIKDPAQRKIFFEKCREIGIAGMKVDFFDSEAQEIVDFYQAALKDAAAAHLMMDFHGANKPTGESRTWPNELSREAIKGLESRPPWAQTTTMVPFTRFLAGHADFTPVNFGERMGEVSWAHHIATLVVFTSPFLCVGADPQNMLDNPAIGMIESIPSVWDETIVLPQSRIGDLVLYARRKGSTWFIAAMNGIHETRNLDIKLDFLGKRSGAYTVSEVKDDPLKQASVLLSQLNVTSASSLSVQLNPEGGFVARLEKKP